jgi:hypothetical protein
MTSRGAEQQDLRQKHAVATAKVRMWRMRASQARSAGRSADADRCDDKVRDWMSRAKQIEQQLGKQLAH